MGDTVMIRVPASDYADHDDSLGAASAAVASDLGVEPWQAEAAWDDEDEREEIVVTVSPIAAAQ